MSEGRKICAPGDRLELKIDVMLCVAADESVVSPREQRRIVRNMIGRRGLNEKTNGETLWSRSPLSVAHYIFLSPGSSMMGIMVLRGRPINSVLMRFVRPA